jgi:antitoxin component YwqK of YwqJK toxin-antitoxin module
MRINFSKTLIFLIAPFCSNAQVILNAPPLEYLRIDSNKLNQIMFNGEIAFKFENYLDNDSSFELSTPDHLPTGKYVAYYKNDSNKLALEITYYNGEKNGTQKEFFLNGNLKITEDFANGKRNGKYIQYYRFPANQVCRYEEYKNGQLNGAYILYCPNGKKNTAGKGKNGLEYGTWLRWDCDDGRLLYKWRYKKGKMVSSKKFQK